MSSLCLLHVFHVFSKYVNYNSSITAPYRFGTFGLFCRFSLFISYFVRSARPSLPTSPFLRVKDKPSRHVPLASFLEDVLLIFSFFSFFWCFHDKLRLSIYFPLLGHLIYTQYKLCLMFSQFNNLFKPVELLI